MALAMRGASGRDELISYAERHDVPAAWRDGPLSVTLGGDPSPSTPKKTQGKKRKKPKRD
jgi:hypothetical protein